MNDFDDDMYDENSATMMGEEKARELIASVVARYQSPRDRSEEEVDPEFDPCHSTSVQITLRDGCDAESAPFDFQLDDSSIKILYGVEIISSGAWDFSHSNFVVFQKLGTGSYGMAKYTSWADMTFSGTTYSIDLSLTDWDDFYNYCLLDIDREYVDAITNPTLGLTSPTRTIRKFAEELHASK